MRRSSLPLAVSLVLLIGNGMLAAAQAAPAAAIVVRPGMAWEWDDVDGPVRCTLAFLFRARGDTYAATAAHCFERNDSAAEVIYEQGARPVVYAVTPQGERGPRIGTAMYSVLRFPEDLILQEEPHLPLNVDFALIQLDKKVGYDPQMCLFGGPTGINRHTSVEPTVAHLYGSGETVAYESASGTTVLPGRTGIASLAQHDVLRHTFLLGVGDSGSPIIDGDGRALATLTSDDGSPRLGPGLDRATHVTGLRLELLTAPVREAPAFGNDPTCFP